MANGWDTFSNWAGSSSGLFFRERLVLVFFLYTTQLLLNVTCSLLCLCFSCECELNAKNTNLSVPSLVWGLLPVLINHQLWACLFFPPWLFSCSWCCLCSLSYVFDWPVLCFRTHLFSVPTCHPLSLVVPTLELCGLWLTWLTPVSASCLPSILVLPLALNCSLLFPEPLVEKMDGQKKRFRLKTVI